jgi:hypothetical protein
MEPVKPEEACVCGKSDCPQGILQAAVLNKAFNLTEQQRQAASKWYEENKVKKNEKQV